MNNRILIIEDEEPIAELLEMNLLAAGYDVTVCLDGLTAEKLLREPFQAALALVDIMLPGKDGFELMEDFRRREIPVIYLTAKADVVSKVKGLKLGAEDYMVKPFEILELLVRIEKVLQRTGKANKILRVKDIEINMEKHQVFRNGRLVSLKPMEYDLLILLLQNKNVALSRDEILRRIWGTDFMGESRTVDVHIGQLRKKLDLGGVIKTIPKLGYRLEED